MMDGLFLLLGSNIEDQNDHLGKARAELSRVLGPPLGQSSLYRTEPWGKKDQEWFLNQVIVYALGEEDPELLLKQIIAIETKLGRKRRERWGPREIDIDILYLGDSVIKNYHLEIPHPGIAYRKFTLMPLVEIAPEKIHPVLGKTQSELLKECQDTSIVKMESL